MATDSQTPRVSTFSLNRGFFLSLGFAAALNAFVIVLFVRAGLSTTQIINGCLVLFGLLVAPHLLLEKGGAISKTIHGLRVRFENRVESILAPGNLAMIACLWGATSLLAAFCLVPAVKFLVGLTYFMIVVMTIVAGILGYLFNEKGAYVLVPVSLLTAAAMTFGPPGDLDFIFGPSEYVSQLLNQIPVAQDFVPDFDASKFRKEYIDAADGISNWIGDHVFVLSGAAKVAAFVWFVLLGLICALWWLSLILFGALAVMHAYSLPFHVAAMLQRFCKPNTVAGIMFWYLDLPGFFGGIFGLREQIKNFVSHWFGG